MTNIFSAPKITPQIKTSLVTRPWRVSVDADIPPGAQIRVIVNENLAHSSNRRKCYINPKNEPLEGTDITGFSFEIEPPPDSIAIPFLYAIVFKGDGKCWSFSAEELARTARSVPDLVLVDPREPRPSQSQPPAKSEALRPYLTRQLFPGSWVSASEVSRPWVFEVAGDTPGDSQLVVTFSAQEADGSVLEKQFVGPCRESLASTTFHAVSYEMTLYASSDGRFTPFLYGVAIEGDARCFFSPVSELVYSSENSHLAPPQVLKAARFFDPPPLPDYSDSPEALKQLTQMFEQGKLVPRAQSAIQLPEFDED